jgi:opacity protein-like surface antigen
MTRTRLILAAVAALACAAPAAAQDSSRYVWNLAYEGESAQYGVPDSDDRAGRIDCEPSGMLSLMASTASDVPPGGSVKVTVGKRTLDGIVVEMGDGNNFSVELAADDPDILALVAGKDLTIGSTGDTWSLPGKGAAKVLKPLLALCATR